MAEAAGEKRFVMADGGVTLRQRPTLLLMTVPLRAAEATLELALAKLNQQRQAACQWLERLGAVRIEFGEPHFAEQEDSDPASPMKAAAAQAAGRRPAQVSRSDGKKDVILGLTAMWEVASKSAEAILVFMDRLQFEAADIAGEAESGEELPKWPTPEERMQELIANLGKRNVDSRAPRFLFISQLSEERLEQAMMEAFSVARRNAERLARAAGKQIGDLLHLTRGAQAAEFARHDRLIQQQRCLAMLAGSSYHLKENEIVSDDPRSVEFAVNVHVSYQIE
jgi:hypothetical protein